MRTSTTLGGLALVVLALLLALWRLSASRASDAPAPGLEDSALHAVHTGAEPPEPGGASSGTSEPLALDLAGASREGAERVPLGPFSRIRVVEAGSGAPAPAARVWLQSEDVEFTDAAWKRAMHRFNDVEPVLAGGCGRELALDERGEVRVPRPGRDLLVAAAHGPLHGEATLRVADPDCLVELKPYHPLTIEVVDRERRPLPGAHVQLLWGTFDPLDHRFDWVADEEGRVRIAKLENQLWPKGYRGPVRVTLAGGVPSDPEMVVFDTDSVPSDAVRLVAGDFGSVVVQLVDPQGNELALEGRAFVEVDWESNTDPASSEPSLALRGGADLYLPLDSGRAVFESIGLGAALYVSVDADGHEPVWREVRGPATSGEEVRVSIVVGARAIVARGQVRGMPPSWSALEIAGASLQGRIGEANLPYLFSTWLQADGPFESEMRGTITKVGIPWLLELSRPGEIQLRATGVPMLDEVTSVLDFGEVVFEPQPLLADLRVVDERGAAIPGAMVEVWSVGSSSERTLPCDEHGLCRLAGPLTDLPVTVHAFHADWLPTDALRIETAGAEHELLLRRAAALEGGLLLPRGLSLDDVDLWLRVDERTTHVAHLVEGGRFRIQACEPGQGTLTVSALGFTLERSEIELVAGRTTELEPIDLRPKLHRFELVFELADGVPWTGGHLEVREPDGELSTWRTIGPTARVLLFAARPSVDLWVGARGARPTLFEDVSDGDRLTLPSAPSVVLLASDVHLPGPPFVVGVRGERVLPEDVPFEADDAQDVEPAILRADGTAWLQVPWAGDYELTWFLRHAVTDVELPIEQLELQRVHVPEESSIPAVAAALTAEELARAVGEAGWR